MWLGLVERLVRVVIAASRSSNNDNNDNELEMLKAEVRSLALLLQEASLGDDDGTRGKGRARESTAVEAGQA